MKIQNLEIYGTRVVSCRKTICDFGNAGGFRFDFEKKKWKIVDFDCIGNSAIAKIVSKSDEEYHEITLSLDEDGAGWKLYRSEVYSMKKVADIDRITDEDLAIGQSNEEHYTRNISEFDVERLERLKEKIAKVTDIEITDIGKYLAPVTYNKYCILHTNQGAHILMPEKKAIYKIWKK